MKKTQVCAACHKILYQNKWIFSEDPHASLAEWYEIKPQTLLLNPGIQRKFKSKKEDVEVLVTLCPNCRREKSQYFEAILQLRNASDEIIDFAINDIMKQKEKGTFITKQESTKHGIDLYITNQTYARNIAHKLQNEFGGVVKTNEQLFSRNKQTSKELFRLNVLVQFSDIKKNDVLKFKDALFKVVSTKERISLVNIETGKKTAITYDTPIELIPTHQTRVTKIRPEVEVLHPVTYESIPAVTQTKLHLDEKVKVVLDKKIYIVG